MSCHLDLTSTHSILLSSKIFEVHSLKIRNSPVGKNGGKDSKGLWDGHIDTAQCYRAA